MSFIQRLRKKMIPAGSQREGFARSLLGKLRRVTPQGFRSDLKQKAAGIKKPTGPGSPVSTDDQNTLGKIQYFKVDEVAASFPGTTSIVPVPDDSNQPPDRVIEGLSARAKYRVKLVRISFTRGRSFIQASGCCSSYRLPRQAEAPTLFSSPPEPFAECL